MPMLSLLRGVVALSLMTPSPPQDSAATLRHLRAQQRSLEWRRRNLLPRESGGGAGGACDARIGKYCYWVGDGPERPKRDAPEFVRLRAAFIAQLDSAAARQPGDLWIAAARVRYLAEAGELPRAITAAHACEGSGWCGALLGYALHLAGEYEAADSAFDAARRALPDDIACEWDDLRPLLPRDAGAPFASATCARRDALARRVWWVATPLFITGSNDLRTEYFARRTRTWIERDEASAQFLWWDDYIPELWMRYGWPTWLTRDDPPVGSSDEPSIIGHDPTPSFALIPREAALRAPFSADESAWADIGDHHALMRYAPPWLHAFGALPYQLARFRRGDSLLVVATYDASSDTSFHATRDARAGLFIGSSPARMRRALLTDAPLRGTLSLTTAPDSALLSLELWSPADSAAARARQGLVSLGGRVSDLLLYDGTLSPAAGRTPSLDDVTPLALATDTIARDRSLGVYWETYAAPDDSAPVSFAVTLQPVGAGWVRRALWSAGIGARASAVRLRWVAPRSATDPAHAVTLAMHALPAGTYRLTVAFSSSGGSGASSRTVILR